MTEMPRFERDAEGTGVIFFLEDDVCVALKGNSETRATAQLWRADDPSTITAPIVGNILTEDFRIRLVEVAGAKFGEDFDYSYLGRLREGLDNIATAFERGTDAETGQAVREFLAVRGPSRPILLLRYAQAAEYFHDRDQEAYATVPQDMRKETWPLRSRGFRRWLRYTFYMKEKQRLGGVNEPAPLRETMIADALAQLEAKAMFEGVRRQAYRRVAEHDGRIYLDLCNKNWEVVEISAEGWRIVEAGQVPVRFVRSKGMDELPAPAGYGSVDSLRELLNLGDEGEHAFRLILAWLMQALRARGPYAVLVLLGERGSAKSTAARILRSLVDPSTVPLRIQPRTPHDLYIDATSSWVISLDNISSLPKWLSDVLCMLATGGGFSTRTLFTDREQELFEAMRPVILNGITDVVTADDLVNRSLIVRLPALAKGSYRTEREIQRTLRDFRPLILNALVDAAVEGLRRVDDVQVQALPRMGDFATWAVATEQALDGEPGAFMRALGISDEEGAQQALETSPLAEPIYELARNAWPNAWEGTATALLQRLRDFADEELTHSKDWPRSASVLSRRLSRLATLFRDVGDIEIRQLPRSDTGGTRRWYIRLTKGGGKGE